MVARLLIIEDNDFSRDLLRYMLEATGHHVLEAENGEVGVRLALEAEPDLILCDLQMPVRSGYDVVRMLHQAPSWRRVPVIAVSALSMAGDREKALAAGFDEYITKPISPHGFVARIEAYLPDRLRTGIAPEKDLP